MLLEDTEGCYLNAQHRLLAVLGVRDLVVVETKDAVLVLPRQRAQDIKSYSAAFSMHGGRNATSPRWSTAPGAAMNH